MFESKDLILLLELNYNLLFELNYKHFSTDSNCF